MRAAPRFPFVAVDVSAEQADVVVAELFELGCAGIEVRDEDTRDSPPEPLDASATAACADGVARALRPLATEPEVSGAVRGETVTLVASFDCLDSARRAQKALAGWPCRVGELVGDEWLDAYKKFFAPFALTETLTVAPPWAELGPELSVGRQVLWLDPGRAFGTGLHATTSLVADHLERHAAALRGCALLDVGTGSGILALSGLLFGARQAVAIDVDPQAIAVARANAERNGLADRIELSTAPVGDLALSFDYVVANIEARVLCELAPTLVARVRPQGTLVLSGVLAPQLDEVVAIHEGLDVPLEVVETRERHCHQDCWIAVALRRSG